MTIRGMVAALVIGTAMALCGCGGGGGTNDTPPQPASNNWDSMLWDQGHWG